MRVERVRYLLAAVDSGSLRAAAGRCGISQPTIGQQITLLEEELDVVLLTRSRAGVRTTPAGHELLPALRRLVEAEDAVTESAMAAGGAYHGKVDIGTVSATAESIVAPVLGRLRERHPGLRFAVREGASTDIEDAVRDGELDFGVITSPYRPVAAGLRRVPLVSLPVGVYTRTDHPLSTRDRVHWRDLEGTPLVTMRAGTVLWETLHRHVPEPDIVVAAMSARTVRVMVGQGAGLGVLARLDTSGGTDAIGTAGGPDTTARLCFVPLADAEPITLCLTQRQDSRPSRAALLARQLVQTAAAELSAGG